MAHNALIHGGIGSGAWTGVTTQLDWQTLDERQFQSINGDLGGVWAPASILVIGGAGFQVTGAVFDVDAPASFDQGLTVTSGDFTVNDTTSKAVIKGSTILGVGVEIPNALAVYYQATFVAAAIFSVGLAANGASLFTSSVTMNTTLHVIGATTLNAALTITAGGASITGTTTLIGDLNAGNINLGGILTVTGHIRRRPLTGLDFDITGGNRIGPGAGASSVADIFIPQLNADRTWQLAPGAEGQEVFISMRSSGGGLTSHVLTILDPAGTTRINLQRGGGATHPYEAVWFVFTGGAWIIAQLWQLTATSFPG